MGYSIDVMQMRLEIEREDVDCAFEAYKKAREDDWPLIHDSFGLSHDPANLAEAFEAHGWEVFDVEDGPFQVACYSDTSHWHEEDARSVLEAVAQWMAPGCCFSAVGEAGEAWAWSFEDGVFRESYPNTGPVPKPLEYVELPGQPKGPHLYIGRVEWPAGKDLVEDMKRVLAPWAKLVLRGNGAGNNRRSVYSAPLSIATSARIYLSVDSGKRDRDGSKDWTVIGQPHATVNPWEVEGLKALVSQLQAKLTQAEEVNRIKNDTILRQHEEVTRVMALRGKAQVQVLDLQRENDLRQRALDSTTAKLDEARRTEENLRVSLAAAHNRSRMWLTAFLVTWAGSAAWIIFGA